jgi:hypothetical protein
LVENRRVNGKVKQHVIRTLGRTEQVRKDGSLEALARSAAKHSDGLMLLEAHTRGEATTVSCSRIGAPLVFERLWRETGCAAVLAGLLDGRSFGFDVERAVFLTVLHRLLSPGSDRAADRWRRDYTIAGVDALELHQLYRAMGWLGEVLPEDQQANRTPFSPRCTKDLVEEALFERRSPERSKLTLVLLDSTSLFFYGRGGETLGQHGFSRDHRPQNRQMVVALVVDQDGWPICCELWPGNTTDIKTLLPVAGRLRHRFHIKDVCVIADRGMMSAETVRELEEGNHGWSYILGARLRCQNEVKNEVLSRAGRYQVVREPSKVPKRAGLKVKEVKVEDRRYVVCLNEEERAKDRLARESVLKSLQNHLRQGDKSLVKNRAFKRFLKKADSPKFEIDWDAVTREARFDGKWVLRTNTDWPAARVALAYKMLWMVEDLHRSAKSLLETRPIFHRLDRTIRGHVFCSFLALLLRKELLCRIAKAGHSAEWAEVLQDLEALTVTEVVHGGKRARLRSQLQGCCGRVFQAVGIAIPPTVEMLE